MGMSVTKMWVSIRAAARSAAQCIQEAHEDRSADALRKAEVFGPETTALMKRSTLPLAEALLRFGTLALANDCLFAIGYPAGRYLHHGGRLDEVDFGPLLPVIKPITCFFAEVRPGYERFACCTKGQVRDFWCEHSRDHELFGLQNEDNWYPGLRLSVYSAILRNDHDSYGQFSEQIVLALFDKSAALTETASESQKGRAYVAAVVAELDSLYSKHCGVPSLRDDATSHQLSAGPENALTGPETVLREANDGENLEAAKDELEAMIGLAEAKQDVRRLMNFLAIQAERRRHGMRQSSQSLHYVFTGNPGTGKTTVARILGKVFHGFGILKTPKTIECDRSKLVGGYVGQTAIKTDEVIQSALDGVLFIDEAYTLAGDAEKFGHGDMYGEEAINTLLKRMEDYRERLVVIVAGYPSPMKRFLNSNPGLESRFTRFFHFEDYSVPDLCRIFDRFCRESEYFLTPAACANAFLLFTAAWNKRDARFGNARFVRNVYEQTLTFFTERLASGAVRLDKVALGTIDGPDIPLGMVGIEPGAVGLGASRWEALCPGCGECREGGLEFLGQSVTCGCGRTFTFSWWSPVVGSIRGLPMGSGVAE
jgi:hypothetical protein